MTDQELAELMKNEGTRKRNPHIAKKNDIQNGNPNRSTKREPSFITETKEALKIKTIDQTVNLHFHHIRMRELDYENYATKSVTDTLVKVGLLHDDRKKWVSIVTHSFERCGKIEEERTIIEVWV